jgi:hypothetical protein
MLARLTATTDLAGLRVVCLLALARGMAGDAVGVGVVGVMATMVEAAGATDAVITALAVMPVVAVLSAGVDLHAVQLVASTAALWPTAVEGSTVEVASTVVAAGSTAAVVDTAAADTGDRGGLGGS